MATHTVVAITCVLIVILFSIQPFGTSKLSNYFAPVVMVWLTANMCFGLYVSALYLHLCKVWLTYLEPHSLQLRRFEGLFACLCC